MSDYTIIEVTEEPDVTLLEVNGEDVTVLASYEEDTVVVTDGEIGPAGPPGPAGPEGPQGPQGAPGAATGSYRHVQATPEDVWTVTHNLGFYPNVTILDSAGNSVEGNEEYLDMNTVRLTFSGAFSGEATFS